MNYELPALTFMVHIFSTSKHLTTVYNEINNYFITFPFNLLLSFFYFNTTILYRERCFNTLYFKHSVRLSFVSVEYSWREFYVYESRLERRKSARRWWIFRREVPKSSTEFQIKKMKVYLNGEIFLHPLSPHYKHGHAFVVAIGERVPGKRHGFKLTDQTAFSL